MRRLNFDLHTGLPYLSLFAPSYRVYKTLARQILVATGLRASFDTQCSYISLSADSLRVGFWGHFTARVDPHLCRQRMEVLGTRPRLA